MSTPTQTMESKPTPYRLTLDNGGRLILTVFFITLTAVGIHKGWLDTPPIILFIFGSILLSAKVIYCYVKGQ